MPRARGRKNIGKSVPDFLAIFEGYGAVKSIEGLSRPAVAVKARQDVRPKGPIIYPGHVAEPEKHAAIAERVGTAHEKAGLGQPVGKYETRADQRLSRLGSKSPK